jgi:hypothetical protein
VRLAKDEHPMLRLSLVTLALLALAPAALAQGAGTFTQTSNGYRWSRGAAAFDLLNRDATWSPAEADAVRLALDKLPDVLLQKVMSVHVDKFYRDARPRALTGPNNAAATTVIERGWVSYGDNLFGATPNPTRVYGTVIHELGHCAQYAVIGRGPILGKLTASLLGTTNWTAISWVFPITSSFRSWNGFVSDYARTNDREDFAESVEWYWLAPDELLRANPAKFVYMRDVVYQGAVSPAASRVPSYQAIAPVAPIITRLGDTQDEQGSMVTVHGQYFMGPLDGGFNRVHYRGKRALHLPLSRTKVVSWVPVIATGPADVTVTTQDGTSAPAAFTIKKAWWKFW